MSLKFHLMRCAMALLMVIGPLCVHAESVEAKRTEIMDRSVTWYVVTYFVGGKPLIETRSPGTDRMTHEMCIAVAQRMNEAAQIGETDGGMPVMFNRCEPAELVIRR